MDVDRTTFLFLTSAIFAATACARSDPAAVPPAGVAIDIPLQPPPPPPTAGSASSTAQPAAGSAQLAEQAVADDDEQPYEPWPGTTDPPLARTIRGQKCDLTENAKGKAACSLKPPPGPTCESIGATRSDCARLSRWLVPRVAEKAAACLNARSGTRDLCLFNMGATCFMESLRSVCVDTSPKVEEACARVMQKCARVDKRSRHMTMDACRAAMSAILPVAHGKFLSCAAESCDLIPCHYAAQR